MPDILPVSYLTLAKICPLISPGLIIIVTVPGWGRRKKIAGSQRVRLSCQQHSRQLFGATVKIDNPFLIDQEGRASVVLQNPTDLTFIMENSSYENSAPEKITLLPHSSAEINFILSEGRAVLPGRRGGNRRNL